MTNIKRKSYDFKPFTFIDLFAGVGGFRKALDRLGDDFNSGSLTHETEMHIDGFDVDYEITNDGSKADLLARVDEIVDDIRAKGSD